MPSSFAWTYVCAASLFFTRNKNLQNDKKTSRFPSSWVWNKQGRRSLANTALLEQLKKKAKHNNSNRKKKIKLSKSFLIQLVLSAALQIFILFTRANKIVVGLVLQSWRRFLRRTIAVFLPLNARAFFKFPKQEAPIQRRPFNHWDGGAN